MRVHIYSIVALTVAATACSSGRSNAQKRAEVARGVAAEMAVPSRPLLDYSQFEVLTAEMAPEVAEDEAKAQVAADLDGRIRARLAGLVNEWPNNGSAGTFTVTPRVVSLRVVSGGARVWLGAFAGNSHMDVDLILKDKASGDVIATAEIRQSAGGMAGAWSGGSTDRNLLNYVADITYAYLRRHGPPEPAPAPAPEG